MTSDNSLLEQRQRLQQRLQEQRQVIAQRLGSASEARSSYPRSITMRLLTQRPGLVIRLVLGFATLLKARSQKVRSVKARIPDRLEQRWST